MKKETYTREEVIKLVDEILQYPDQVIDSVSNENTDLGAEDLIELAEVKKWETKFTQDNKPLTFEKFRIDNNPGEGCLDLSWDEELYNAFCDYYHDDGSNDTALQKRLKELLLKFLEANKPSEKQEPHYFVRHNLDKNDRYCDKCGLYFTDNIHFRDTNQTKL